jgi:hypothetical protein
LVTSPEFAFEGFTPATVYVEVLVLVVGGLGDDHVLLVGLLGWREALRERGARAGSEAKAPAAAKSAAAG